MTSTTAITDKSGRNKKWIVAGWLVAIGAAGVLAMASLKFATWEREHAPPPAMPMVCAVRPADGEINVTPNAFVVTDIYLPNVGEGVDARTMTTKNVQLLKLVDGKEIPVEGNVNTSGGGDDILFQPLDMLDVGTKYKFVVNGVRDGSGALFHSFISTFTTASAATLKPYPAAFDHIQLKDTEGDIFTGLTVGPDHRLYAGTKDGRILRYDFLPDGMLSKPFVINTIRNANKGPDNILGDRLITGLCFDPHAPVDSPVIWVNTGVSMIEHCPDWSCKTARLSGPDFSKYEDCIVGLPRAWRDHLACKITFGPDGFLYFNQGSDSSTGGPDTHWGLRSEHLLTASCLRVDTAALSARLAAGKGPLNVKTEDDGNYDPYAPGAPVTMYATGIRCGFSMLWHSNGHLYSCLNGGAAGGATPGTPDDLADVPRRPDLDRFGPYNGGIVPAIKNVTETQPDLVIDIVKGAYYGHPNEKRGEYVAFGGNPDGKSDKYEVHGYPVGTKPDRNWHPALWNLGLSLSANGLIEYKGNAFGGALNGKILTTRYSGGKDILVLEPGPDGKIVRAITGIDGFTRFVDPLDLAEDPATGNLYVSEFGGHRLTLLRPRTDGVGSQRTIQETENKSAAALALLK